MKFDSYKCDVCGTMKQDTNHWFKFRSYPDEGNGSEFNVNTWCDTTHNYPVTKHLCSDQCVVKTVQAWLSAQKEAS